MAEENKYNILIECGADFVLPFTWYDNNGSPYDLTGATVEAQLREFPEAVDFYEFVCVHNGAGGRITISLPQEVTSQISYSYGVYDVFVNLPNGGRKRPLHGEVTVQDYVTKPIDGTMLYMIGITDYDTLPEVGIVNRLYFCYEDRKIYRWNGLNYVATSVGNGIQRIDYLDGGTYRMVFDDGTYFDFESVPRIMGLYDDEVEYEKLDIVHGADGATYLAKLPVPADTPLSDATYWQQLTQKTPTITSEDVSYDYAQTHTDLVTNTGTADAPNYHFKVPRGVTGNESIDDDAGEDDDDVVWSADKSYQETAKKSVGKNIVSEVTTAGAINYSTGADRNTTFYSGAYKRSDYIKVSKGDTLLYANAFANDSSCIVAYYDSEKVYDSTNSVVGIGKGSTHGTVTFPDNGFIRVSSSNDYLVNATFKLFNPLGKQVFQMVNADEVLHKTATKSNFLVLNIGEVTKNKNCYIDSDTGGVVSSPSRNISVSDFYPCCSGDKLSYKLSSDNGYPILATYDDNLNLVRIVVTGSGGSSHKEGVYTFLSDEKYFRVSINYSPSYIASDYINYETNVTVFSTIDTRLTALENTDEPLPDYWVTYLDSKIPTLRDMECDLGNKGIEFAFVTDTHVPVNEMHSPDILKYLYKRMNFPYVINGGDTLDTSPTKADALDKFYSWKQAMKGLPEFCVLGNHDKNSLSQDEPTAVLSSSQFHRMMNACMEDNKFANFSTSVSSNNIYYLIDNPDQKFRIIVLSTSFGYSSSSAEKPWFKDRLTELDSTWSILVVTHYMWHVVPDMHAVGTAILTAINEVYTQIQAQFVGVLAGHSHEDYSMSEATYGYNVVATICDGMRSGTIYDRTVGTTSEQAIDMVFIDTNSRTWKLVRIGAGDDVVGDGTGVREFSF